MLKKPIYPVCFLVLVVLTACASVTPISPGPTPAPSQTPTIAPTRTPMPVPTDTPPPAPTATPADTPTPTLTPTPMHPLMIESLRAGSYPGSEIVIEETLDPGVNYDRSIVSYQSEGLKIYALLTVPLGEKPETGWPVIIFNHGYIPPDQYRTTERYIAYVDGFARNGYIVFRPDYRGHGSSEGEADGACGSPAYTVDVLNAVAALAGYEDADPDRIGMWGHSMGGHITLQVMVASPDIKAGVIWAGLMGSYQDLLENWWWPRWGYVDGTPGPGQEADDERNRWMREIEAMYGTFEENPAFWNTVDTTAYLADLSGPIQLHHGTADTSVAVEFSANLFVQIQTLDLPVELYVYEGDNHNISNNFGTAMARSIDFFDRHLKDDD